MTQREIRGAIAALGYDPDLPDGWPAFDSLIIRVAGHYGRPVMRDSASWEQIQHHLRRLACKALRRVARCAP
jgi:hypothetical protein